MTWLAALALRLGIPERLARIGLIVLALLLLVVGLGVAKCSYDRDLVAAHDAQRDARLAEDARAADANAAEARRVDDARLSSESIQLDKVTANASLDQPISPARRAYYDCIGLQQAARAAGRPAPACH